jgi:hypothetical protein
MIKLKDFDPTKKYPVLCTNIQVQFTTVANDGEQLTTIGL